MKRFPIRDSSCPSKNKTRIFDLLISDTGEKRIEVKDGKVLKSILLEDAERQIAEIKRNN